jgi:HSP20 family protein
MYSYPVIGFRAVEIRCTIALHGMEAASKSMEICPMASSPVEVKQTTPAPAPARTPAADPWHSLRNERDRLFDRFSGAFGMPSLRRMFDWESALRPQTSFSFAAPSVDVSEDDKAYKITAELPGLESKDVEISITGDTLILKDEKKEERQEHEKNYHMSERTYGSFQRAFALPDQIDRNQIAADLAKGVLTITLPKTKEAQKPAQKIEIKAAT